MSTSDIGVLLGSLAALLSAWTGLWIGRAKNRADKQAREGDRIAALEERLDALERSRDEERGKRRAAEDLAHQLRLGLMTAVGYMEEVARWVSIGAPPPSPALPDMGRLRDLIEE